MAHFFPRFTPDPCVAHSHSHDRPAIEYQNGSSVRKRDEQHACGHRLEDGSADHDHLLTLESGELSNSDGIQRSDSELVRLNASDRSIQLSVVLMPTLSPCIGSAPVLVAVLSRLADGESGAFWDAVWVIATKTITSSATMLVLVLLSSLSASQASRYNSDFLQKYEKLLIAVSLGALSLYLIFSHHGHSHSDSLLDPHVH
eukprot:CAMPEP_0185848738 /NCGR_PEP_ID=MMETSP1354-20130828/3501_1 /TAXON_ID=708628 /ORGANISM="Erythrolobus madagascarensis, Strain CCMP3276" /LENGTH=200 /DNA_ID=CAMNT_0028549171 /DNA_START=144 /DNA_END=746 /DNA_ORIENTATION=-